MLFNKVENRTEALDSTIQLDPTDQEHTANTHRHSPMWSTAQDIPLVFVLFFGFFLFKFVSND